MKKLVVLLSVVAMVLSLAGCAESDDGMVGGVNFTSSNSSTLIVNNDSNVKLVLFKNTGGTSIGTVIAGVPALAQNHGVPNVTSTEGLFILNVVTYDDYVANPSDPKIASSQLVYVDNIKAVYTVGAFLNGTGGLELINQSDYYIEIRDGSIYGTTFTVSRPGDRKRMYLPTGTEYDLFPVVKVPRWQSGVLVGLVEKKLTNSFKSFGAEDEVIIQWVLKAQTGLDEHTVTYITVVNNFDNGLRAYSGSSLVKNSMNREIINSGRTADYTFETATSVTKALEFRDAMGGVHGKVNDYTFVNGNSYTVTIPSNADQNTIIVPVDNGPAVTPSGIDP